VSLLERRIIFFESTLYPFPTRELQVCQVTKRRETSVNHASYCVLFLRNSS
jgi:hypothetical protein